MRSITHSDEIDRMTFPAVMPASWCPPVTHHTSDCDDGGCAPDCPERIAAEGWCTCCDLPGILHLQNVDQLRRFLDTPSRESTVEIEVADVWDEPYALAFVTAGEAEAWLEDYDERVREELSIERVLGPRA